MEANSNGLAFDWGEGNCGSVNVEMGKGSVEGMPWASAHLTCCLESLFRGNRVKGTQLQCVTVPPVLEMN